jgi:hypothetical protein
MSFVNLMASDIWSEADIVRRTEALAHAELTIEEEAILSRKVLSAMLGKWEMSAEDLATQARFVHACTAAHTEGVAARADMALLQSAMDYENGITAEASAEVLALVNLRNSQNIPVS